MGGRGAGSASSGKKAGGGGVSEDMLKSAWNLGYNPITSGNNQGWYDQVKTIDERYQYQVKPWFADKENLGDDFNGAPVFGVLKETEKAVYAMVANGVKGGGYTSRRTLWIPKSQLLARETPEAPVYKNGKLTNPGVLKVSDYDSLSASFKEANGFHDNRSSIYREGSFNKYWGKEKKTGRTASDWW